MPRRATTPVKTNTFGSLFAGLNPLSAIVDCVGLALSHRQEALRIEASRQGQAMEHRRAMGELTARREMFNNRLQAVLMYSMRDLEMRYQVYSRAFDDQAQALTEVIVNCTAVRESKAMFDSMLRDRHSTADDRAIACQGSLGCGEQLTTLSQTTLGCVQQTMRNGLEFIQSAPLQIKR